MNKNFKKASGAFILGFFLFFGLRLLYGFWMTSEGFSSDFSLSGDFSETFNSSKKNYASYSVDQKYEKIASLFSKTRSFEDDSQKIRDLVSRHGSLIQSEQSEGLPGTRSLNLAIGVPPDRFDQFIDESREIGRLGSIRIDKSDKTNEYKELRAQRVSLEKMRDALKSLKEKGGRLDESINLENRIFEIESQIQSLSVKLGEYDQENEFCTVQFQLREWVRAKVSFAYRAKVAFEWTVKFYLALWATFGLFSICFWAVGKNRSLPR